MKAVIFQHVLEPEGREGLGRRRRKTTGPALSPVELPDGRCAVGVADGPKEEERDTIGNSPGTSCCIIEPSYCFQLVVFIAS